MTIHLSIEATPHLAAARRLGPVIPWLQADVSAAVAPRQVALNRRLLFVVVLIIGVVQREFAQGSKMTIDPVEPRGPDRRPVESDAVRVGVGQNRGLAMVADVVQHDVQRARSAVCRLPTPRKRN